MKMQSLCSLGFILTISMLTEAAVVDPNILLSSVDGSLAVGQSFVGSSISHFLHSNEQYKVKVALVVHNLSKQPLTDPDWIVKHGVCEKAPVPIGLLNGTKELMTFMQNGQISVDDINASSGMVSWLISSRLKQRLIRRRLVVMWYAPGSFTTNSKNTLAIGITQNGDELLQSFYDDMRSGRDNILLDSESKQFYKRGGSLVFDNEPDYQIIGTMTSEHKSEIKIYIVPKRAHNFEPFVLTSICETNPSISVCQDKLLYP